MAARVWAQGEETNLVPNPSFELGADSPDQWKFSSWKNATGSWDDSFAYHGQRSVKLTGENGGWNTTIQVRSSALHRLTLRYRSQGGPSRIVAYVRDLDGKAKPLLYNGTPAIPHTQKGAFEEGQYIDGADDNGWVFLDVGSFAVAEKVSEVNLLIKLTSKDQARVGSQHSCETP
jgi:hypothetical protein